MIKSRVKILLYLIIFGIFISFQSVNAVKPDNKFCDTNTTNSDGLLCSYPMTWSNTGNANINLRCANESVAYPNGCPVNTASSTYAFSCVNNNCTMTCVTSPTKYIKCSNVCVLPKTATSPCTSVDECTGVCSACNNGSTSSNTCVWPDTWSNASCSCVAGTSYTLRLGADSTANGNTGTNILQSGSQAALFINAFKIGIGTSTPDTNLHLFDSTNGPLISLSGLFNKYRGFRFTNTSNDENFFAGLNDNNNFVLRRSNAYDIFTASTTATSIGIGTSLAPISNYELTVSGKLKIYGALGEISIDALKPSAGTNKIIMINDTGVLYATSSLVATGIPTGTAGQTLYSNASNIWTASTALYNDGANIAIGTTTTLGNKLHIAGGSVTISQGNLNLMNVNNIIGVNKLTVTTIDPLYNIFGVNYSSYAASFVGGVKEEVSGKINIETKIGKEYQAVIDFDKQALGSDLWVWRKVIDFNKNNVDAFITPYGKFADTYYYVSGNRLVFRSNTPVEISYRLIAKRFDWRKWPTLAEDQTEKAGLIIK